jgi:hypothetical protein
MKRSRTVIGSGLVTGLALALLSVVLITGTSTEPLLSPDWAAMFNPSGKLISRQGGLDAIFLEDKVSDGVGIDMSICPDPADPTIVDNGVVAPENDLGNGYVWATTDADGSLILHAGVERMASALDTFVEFEFNQGVVQVRSGRPWPIHGERTAGDLVVRVDFMSGAISSAEFLLWDGTAYETLIATGPDGCTGVDYRYCAGAPPMLSVQDEVWDATGNLIVVPAPDSFVEIGFNVLALLGANVEFTSIQVRTPRDIILSSFRHIGLWAQSRQEGGQ